MAAHQNFLAISPGYQGEMRSRCECHECTQARAMESRGTLKDYFNRLPQQQIQQNAPNPCPHCGKLPTPQLPKL